VKLTQTKQLASTDRPTDEIDWNDPQQRRWLKWLCEQRVPEGLSALARHCLGNDYWKIETERENYTLRAGKWRWKHGIWTTCGLVDWGPNRLIQEAYLANGDKVILCSRDGLKTANGIADYVQLIITDRDTRGMVYMETGKNAEKTVAAIRRCLERDRVIELWGSFEGEGKSKSKDWGKASFTVIGREVDHRIPTVQVGGADVNTTGDHVLWCWIDDPLSYQSARSTEVVNKVIDGWLQIQPLIDAGGHEAISLTPYARGDMADRLLSEHAAMYHIIRIPCGYTAYYDDRGQVALKGKPNFPHLTYDYLLKKARKMGPTRFNLNYGLSMDDTVGSVFRREDLIPDQWQDRFSYLSAYVLCDTAFSTSADACLSVLALVIMDWDDTAYVADMRIGRWSDDALLREYLLLRSQWEARVRIVGTAMERVTLNVQVRSAWEREMRTRGVRWHWIELRRSATKTSGDQGVAKSQRIRAMESRVRAHKLRCLPSIPKTVMLNGVLTTLYDPHGMRMPDGSYQPAGELVEQMVRWNDSPYYKGLQDIPDCLAALDEMSYDGRARAIPPSSRAAVPQLSHRPAGQRPAARVDLLSRIRRGGRTRT
jgi:hypothetical protein